MAGFDPCTALSESDLQSYGVTKPGEPVDQGIGETGCDFKTDDFLLTVYKSDESDMAYWEGRKDRFGIFETNRVGSHEGIKTATKGSAGLGMCTQIVLAGSGSISVQINYSSDKNQGNDVACAKAMEIAQVVEPKLPK
ncbi:Protein of unknown function [Saccharopolyspora kobensis]|uniref:DUF3558 domain-containing protein n=1 Tax=Saccharopolyspora kobensis TaxID=146035 RepID=A0A1H6ECE3_9PSEU|nr:Protein of unknown function [Saccharopolyspora kobensis]SFD56287.1 Protein of unknown function [Saccharopolyspora kobensis]